jgi:hypothetical protein
MGCVQGYLTDTYLSSLSFNLVQPDTARVESLRFPLERRGRADAELLGLPGQPVDVFNTSLPRQRREVVEGLRRLCGIPRMSTFAVAALINNAVAQMPAGQAYVNVGVYAGFSFLAGMLENPARTCVGIDDFSWSNAARAGLRRRFEAMRSPAHRFHEMDYLDYFTNIQSEPIGVYVYDGDHAYDHQLRGLEIAEPFFADGCIVVVDDINWEAPREATIDFVARSERHYDVLMDRSTHDHAHPTLWNGLMVLQATGRRRSRSPAEVRAAFPQRTYTATRPAANVEPRAPQGNGRGEATDTPLVSVVLIDDDLGATSPAAAIDACLEQTWPRTELVVLDRSGGKHRQVIAERYGDLEYVEASVERPAAGLADALARTTGEVVALADTAEPLRRTAVEVAIRLPDGTPFFLSYGDTRYAEHERAVFGG